LLRGITLWALWIEQNDLVFNNERWNVGKIHKVIWDALLDYGTATWNRCMRLIKKTLRVERKLLEKFDKSSGRHRVICVRIGNFVRWCYDGPWRGFHLLRFRVCGCASPLLGVCCSGFSSHWILFICAKIKTLNVFFPRTKTGQQ
jgi:hypothetical protein